MSSFLNSAAFVQFIAFPTITSLEKKSQHRHLVAGNRSIFQKSEWNLAVLLYDPVIEVRASTREQSCRNQC